MNPKARHKARELALQAIYQWQFTADSPESLEKQFREATNSKKIDLDYFAKLVHGTINHSQALDKSMCVFLDRDIKDLNAIELSALRLAIYELTYHLETPAKVIINEALELTKSFGSIEGFKYVNAVLDKVAHKLRTNEF